MHPPGKDKAERERRKIFQMCWNAAPVNQIRPLGHRTPWRCQPHDNRSPAAWMIPAWAVFPQPLDGGRIASLHDHSLPTVPHQPCAGHSRARDYTMPPPGRACTCDSWRPEVPQVAVWEARRRKSLSPLGCGKCRTFRPLAPATRPTAPALS